MREMKSNSELPSERVDEREATTGRAFRFTSSFIPHPSTLLSQIPAHRSGSGADGVERGGEGETQVAFAVFAEDDAGDGGDLRAVEQDFGGDATVGVDARNIGESIERPGGRRAVEADLVQTRDHQVAPFTIGRARLRKKVRRGRDGG